MGDDLESAADEHFDQGNTLDQNGNREAAVKEWQEAVHLDPNHAAAHYNLGIAYADDGDLAAAVAELRLAVRNDPFDVDSRRELADLYLEQGNFGDGVDQLRQALNIAPSDGETASLLAQAYADHELWDEAAGALEAGGMLEEDADLWYRLGKAYEQAGRRDDAILAYRRALICNADHRPADQALRRLHVPVEEPPDLEEPA